MSIALLTEYTIENEIKIARFDEVGNSIPLYVKNLTIVESITTTEVKIKMKMSEFFLVNVIEKKPLNFPLRSRDLEGIAKGFSKGK
jgi:hypothetical protein